VYIEACEGFANIIRIEAVAGVKLLLNYSNLPERILKRRTAVIYRPLSLTPAPMHRQKC
jgi:hypothetical protein